MALIQVKNAIILPESRGKMRRSTNRSLILDGV